MSGKGKTKGPQKATKSISSRKPATKLLQGLGKHLVRVAKAIRRLPLWADVFGVILFAVFLYQVNYSLVPVIQPDPAVSSSSLDLPITARNPGDFFALKDVQFFCDLAEQRFERDKSQTFGYPYYRIKGLVEWPIPQPPLTIAPGETVSFPCNIVQNSVMKLDGVQAETFLIHLSIRTTYSVKLGILRWHREAKSQTFTWKKVSGEYQWLPGETLEGPK